MKKTLILIVLLIGFTAGSYGQSKLKSRDLRGEWQMVLDISDELEDNLEDGLDEGEDAESDLGEMIASAAISMAQGILEGLEIKFNFQRDGRLEISVEVMGEREVEYSQWEINQEGELVIGDDDDDEVWMLEDEILMGYIKKGDRLKYKNVYLMRVDRD